MEEEGWEEDRRRAEGGGGQREGRREEKEEKGGPIQIPMLCGLDGFGQGPGCLSLFKQAEAHCKALSWGHAKSFAKPGQAPATQTQSRELPLPTKPLSRPHRG